MKAAQSGEVLGAPFPKYMRKARRNRPHKRNRNQGNGVRNDQEYVVTAADLEERNPIIASKKDIEISEDGKALYRKVRNSAQLQGDQLMRWSSINPSSGSSSL
jgi:hypothetical protein